MLFFADDVYNPYIQDSQKVFYKAKTWYTSMQAAPNNTQQALIVNEILENMIRAIFGSNMIEQAGLGWYITEDLCRRVFAGEHIEAVSEKDASCQEVYLDLCQQQADLPRQPIEQVLRGRNEIVQHAKAYQHLIHEFVIEKQDLTEDLIKATHAILTEGVPIVEPNMPIVPPEKYDGIYRSVIVIAGTTNFTVPSFIPAKMEMMCGSLKSDMATAAEQNTVDPFSLAAKYSLEFVSIHPFQDGNGRMCRMILNAILCRYAGIIIPIGEQAKERKEYLEIKVRGCSLMLGHGEYATFVLQRAVPRLRKMKKLAGTRAKGSGGKESG
ncbi:fic/DOC family protein [Dactylonectria macrodidyma]|uniref:Fic/DOC family protein n=1 Tax=Dactylonectria macrodidyma TaxID=307937 RepID=A0A9P9FTH8_9HYPO|nr:fic/DOC family protein [Dactylonectria macrodidyma]